MKDPVIVGAILSAGILLVLAVWRAPVLRWAAICIALGVLAWAISQAALVADLQHPRPACTAAMAHGHLGALSTQAVPHRTTLRAI
ncbi:hypothetical protein [Variovorax sp. GT1P44]|uniref:hypothetical protein n=1 Tax=Variovorax sp. GT1P44 TaxID=3443742 RepID=UPI003F48ED15